MMDPNACLERLCNAYVSSNFEEIRDASKDLLEWIQKGGFIPTVTEPQLSALLIMATSYGERGVVKHG